MSDDADGDRELPLRRREVLKWGVAGAVADEAWFKSLTDPLPSRNANAGQPRQVPMKTHPRDYLPMDYPLSIRGIAPDRNTQQGANVWLSPTRFSVKELIAEQQFDRRPVSLREIVTPQRKASTAGATWSSSKDWQNWLEDYAVKTAPFYNPSDRKQLLRTVARFADDHFRAVGSGHSHSEAARPKSNYSDVENLKGDLGTSYLKPKSNTSYWNDPNTPDRDKLVRVGAGTILKELNRLHLPNKNLALPNMGSYDGQSLAGAINTSTHGTGIDLGSLGDVVKSVELVAVPESPVGKGEPVTRMFRIEPDNGITDPEAFGNHTDEHDMALIQDTDIFRSAVVGYGSLGVATAYTLEVRDAYWLEENTNWTRWHSVSPRSGAQNNRHYSLVVELLTPQAFGNTNPHTRVRTRNPALPAAGGPTERVKTRNRPHEFINVAKEEFEQLIKPKNPKNVPGWGNPNKQINNPQRFFSNLFVNQITQSLTAPFEQGRSKTASYIALRRPPAKSPNKKRQEPEEPINAITTEIAVPATDVNQAVNTVISEVQKLPVFTLSLLGVRFVDESHQHLSPEYNRKTAMLEYIIPMPEALRDISIGTVLNPFTYNSAKAFADDYALQKYKAFLNTLGWSYLWDDNYAKSLLERIEGPLIKQYGGRPHMGKHNSVNWQSSHTYKRPQNMYPKYDEWLDAFEFFNQFKTFDNVFTDNKAQKRTNARQNP